MPAGHGRLPKNRNGRLYNGLLNFADISMPPLSIKERHGEQSVCFADMAGEYDGLRA